LCPYMKRIAVVIPAYNAGGTLEELMERTARFADRKDVVVIDDGSNDGTFRLAEGAGAVVLRHGKNRGKGEALKTGFDRVLSGRYAALITIDADLQHPPESIPEFTRRAERFPGILIGTRRRNLRIMPFSRWLTNHLTSVIVSVLSGTTVRDSQSGYRLIPLEVLRDVELKSSKYDLESEILIKAARKGYPIGEVPISTIYQGSTSFINPIIDTGRFIKLMWRSLWW
jgi:glycosyltransferase involved in cell wall biosynthesis